MSLIFSFGYPTAKVYRLELKGNWAKRRPIFWPWPSKLNEDKGHEETFSMKSYNLDK